MPEEKPVGERLAVLEVKISQIEKDVASIRAFGWKLITAMIATGALSPAVFKLLSN